MRDTKPGWATTEGIFTGLISAVMGGYGLENENPMVQATAVAAIGFMVGMYALSRGKVKGGAA